MVTPIFYFMIFIRTVLPFDEKKLAQIYEQFFGNFTKLYGIELSRVVKRTSNFNSSTLERKVKTRA